MVPYFLLQHWTKKAYHINRLVNNRLRYDYHISYISYKHIKCGELNVQLKLFSAKLVSTASTDINTFIIQILKYTTIGNFYSVET